MEKLKQARIESKNIITKSLFEELNKTLFDAITKLDIRWTNEEHRTSFIDVVEDYLQDIVSEQKITNYKIICDHRNNKNFLQQKEILFSVKYKQPHCLNWTTINYYVKK